MKDGLIRLTDSGEIVETRWVTECDVVVRGSQPMHKEHGVRLVGVAEKMSKSRGNVVNPDAVVAEFGADSLRLYEMFMGPIEQPKPWQTSGIQGVRRFLERVHAIASRPLSDAPVDEATLRLAHRTIKKVGEDIEALRFNTAVSAMMILANHLVSFESPARSVVRDLVLCLSPFAPHLAEELWSAMGYAPSITEVDWPSYEATYCVDTDVEMAVQVNGKVRGRITVAKDTSAEVARMIAMQEANVQRFVGESSVKKFIYVPGKIINIILG